MKVCLYARVSTSDKDQDPMTQLLPLREFVKAQSWETYHEYIDYAPATDLYHRTGWKDLLDEASKRRFDLLACMADGPGLPFRPGCRHHFRETPYLGRWPSLLFRAVARYYLSLWRSPLLYYRGIRLAGTRHPQGKGQGRDGESESTGSPDRTAKSNG